MSAAEEYGFYLPANLADFPPAVLEARLRQAFTTIVPVYSVDVVSIVTGGSAVNISGAPISIDAIRNAVLASQLNVSLPNPDGTDQLYTAQPSKC